MNNIDVLEHDVNRRRYYRRSLGERTPLIELITVCYCIVASVRRLTCDTHPLNEDRGLFVGSGIEAEVKGVRHKEGRGGHNVVRQHVNSCGCPRCR